MLQGKQEEVLEVMYTYILENMANEEFEQMQRLIQVGISTFEDSSHRRIITPTLLQT